ncbi:phage tail tube protein [Paucibacter sp. R3-3]|uniref:Phage tail tube protein n=1 Tax=Roseateles agri TaxID=3098619 RepID=A0ABU5DQA5_9BURK|nr:phage tail tube protein [Paucibacter sp. R3-3]MDY0748504.1 phage tail tube protein [Paucibacter sp. R3-3]
MGTPIVGRNVKVEVSKTEGAAKTIAEVTNAKPAVASCVGHGLAAKSCGYFRNVVGMVKLEGQAVRIASVTTDSFTIEGLDTTTWGDFTAGEFVPITAWSTLAEATSYQIPDGTADQLDTTTLLDDDKQTKNGQANARTVTYAVIAQQTNSEAGDIVEAAAANQAYLVQRITFNETGATRIFRGQPSEPGENVAKSAVGTGSITSNVKGRILKGAP